jgi:hypothetical protein
VSTFNGPLTRREPIRKKHEGLPMHSDDFVSAMKQRVAYIHVMLRHLLPREERPVALKDYVDKFEQEKKGEATPIDLTAYIIESHYKKEISESHLNLSSGDIKSFERDYILRNAGEIAWFRRKIQEIINLFRGDLPQHLMPLVVDDPRREVLDILEGTYINEDGQLITIVPMEEYPPDREGLKS